MPKPFSLLFSSFLVLFFPISVFCQSQQILPVGQAPVSCYSSAQGATTYYLFSFSIPDEIKSNAFLNIVFPPEFTSGLMPPGSMTPECGSMSPQFVSISCQIVNGWTVSINMGSFQAGVYSFIIGQILNPQNLGTSSAFKVRTYQNTGLIDFNDNFGQIAFSPPPTTMISGSVYPYGSQPKISTGTPYRFVFTLNQQVSAGNSIRITYPLGYSSQNPGCAVDNLAGPAPQATVLFNQRIIVCQNLQKTLLSESVVISQVISPPFSGLQRGFIIEVLQGVSPVVLQQISFNGDIYIPPGTPKFTVTPNILFKAAYATYTFTIVLANKVNQNGALYLNFTSQWTLYSSSCRIKQGGTALPNIPINCSLDANDYAYKISGFSSFDKNPNIVIDIDLYSPITQGQYLILFSSYDFQNNALIDLTSATIAINSTYGTISSFLPHAQISPIKLPAGQAGPLEIIFFLNYELPPTNGATEGKFIIDIYPQIQLPNESLYGKVNCFFFYTVISGNDGCTTSWDVSDPTKTTLTVYTPQLRSFKESEIPLTITTSGPATGYNAGILIDSLIKRYVFQIRIYSTGETNPHEVFFIDWIPDFWVVPSGELTITPVIKEANEWNYLIIKHQIQHDLPSPRNYVFRLTFSTYNTGWYSQLGYSSYSNASLIPFPCFSTTGLSAVPYINCDLIIGSGATNSYIYVYGFAPLTKNTLIDIHLPKIRNGPTTNLAASVIFEVLEETWEFRLTYVTLYQNIITVFTVQPQTISSYTTSAGFSIASPDSSIVNSDSSYVFTYIASSAASYVIFELPQSPTAYINSIPRSSISCGSGSDVCLTYETAVQWNFYIPATPTTAISVTLPSGTLKNGVWVNSATSPSPTTFTARVIGSSGNTIAKIKNTLTINKATISTISFDKDASETTLYQNSEHLFVISWTSVNSIPAGGSITLVFSGVTEQVSKNFYCSTSGLSVLSTNSVEGISCSQSSASTILVSNIDTMAAASSLSVSVRLVTGTTNTNAQATVSTYRDNAQTELVEQGSAIEATAYGSAKGLSDFYVISPVASQGIISNVLPIVITLNPTSTTAISIIVTFPTGFTSPSGSTTDYSYCTLGSARVSCSYTLSPLIYTVTLSSSLSGSNTLTLSTIYTNPINGIKMPSTPGYYNIQVALKDTSNAILEKNSKYIFVAPARLVYFQVQMAHRTFNQPNLFIISFQNSLAINKYNDVTQPGKIRFYFPKYANDLSTAAFASDLGTGLSASGIIPCSFSGLTALSGTSLHCRLIPSSSSSDKTDYATVEVINFNVVAANTDIIIYIANVKNPVAQVKDATIKADIFEVLLSSGSKNLLHQDSYDLFMNIDLTSPDLSTSYMVDYSGTSLTFAASSQVYDTQKSLSLQIWTHSNPLNPGDFFFTYLPSSLSNLGGATFSDSYIFPDANLVIFKITSTIGASTSTPAPVTIDVFKYASQTDIVFYSYVIQNGLFTQQVAHVYKATDLASLIGSITSASLTTFNTNTKQPGRTNTEILLTFTNSHLIPNFGSIAVEFPADFTKIYGGCRSYVTGTSQLTSKLGAMVGGISCNVISGTTTWQITGFSNATSSTVITLYGNVDIPISNTNSLTIKTYYNQDLSGTNGQIIDQVTSGITLSSIGATAPLLPDSSFTFKNLVPVTVGSVAPINIFFQVATAIASSGNGKIIVSINNKDQLNSNSWTISTSLNYICIIKRLTDSVDIPCQIGSTPASSPATFTLTILATINSGVDHQLTLTTLYQSTDGITHSSTAGLYIVSMSFYASYSGSITYSDNKWIEVYPPAFSSISVTSYVPGSLETLNPIEIKFTTPASVTLTTANYLVIDLPTATPTGTLLGNDGGLGITYDNQQLTIDELTSTTQISACYGFLGSTSDYQPAKIQCSFTSIAASTTVDFVFYITNPTIASGMSLSIPITVSIISNTNKAVFSYVENGIYLREAATMGSESSSPSFLPSERGLTSTSFLINYPSAGTALVNGVDAFVVKVSFTLSKITSGTCDSSSPYVACSFKTLPNKNLIIIWPGSSGIVAASQLKLNGFTNPSSFLTSLQMAVYGYSYLFSANRIYQYFQYTSLTTSSITLQSTTDVTLTGSVLFTNEVNQLSQYQFQMAWSSSTVKTLTKSVSIQYPVTITFLSSDCMTAYQTTADAELSSCYIDITNHVIYMEVYSWHSASGISINTRFKGVINPPTNAALGDFQLHVYSITKPSHTSDEGLVYKSDTIIISTMTFVDSNGGSSVPKPAYLEIIDLPYQDRVYAPKVTPATGYFYVKFAYAPSAAVTDGALVISYNNAEISIPSKTTVNDVYDNNLLCLIDDVQYTCTDTGSQFKITGVSFSTGTTYRVSIGVTNIFSFPASTYVKNGLSPFSTTTYHTTFIIESKDSTQSTVYDHGEIRHAIIQENSIDPTTVSLNYMNTVAGRKNIFSLTVKSPTSTTWDLILFEFQTIDENGNTIFDADLGGFADGGEFPCETTVSDGAKRPTCYFKKGSINNLGLSAYVVMKNIPTVSGGTTYEYILAGLKNPAAVLTYVPLKVYFFSQSSGILQAYVELDRIFETTPDGVSVATSNDQFIGSPNYQSTFTMLSDISVSSSTYILVEDVSPTLSAFSIQPSSSSTIVRKMFSQDTSQNRLIFYAIKVSGGVTAYSQYNIPQVTLRRASSLIFHHYATDFVTGEVLTTTSSTTPFDCFSSASFEVAHQKTSTPSYMIFKLIYSSSGNCPSLNFINGNVLVLDLSSLLDNNVNLCNVIEGMTPTISSVSIDCSISSKILTITGWNSLSTTIKLFLSVTTNNAFTSGSAVASIFYSSGAESDSIPFIKSSLSGIAWPTATTNTETTFLNAILIDLENSLIQFNIVQTSVTFTSLTITFGSEFSFSSTSITYSYYDGSSFTSPVSTTISSKSITLTIDSTLVQTNNPNIKIFFNAGAVSFPIWNIAFFTVDTDGGLRNTVVNDCSYGTTALQISTSSLTQNPSTQTELSLTFTSTSFDTTQYNAVLIELGADWSFTTTSSGNDFVLPCMDSTNTEQICYGHLLSSTGFPILSITYLPTGSTLPSSLYISNIKTPSTGTSIAIKYINMASFAVNTANSVSARLSTNILYTSMNINTGSSVAGTANTGTLTLTINGNNPIQIFYTNNANTLTITFTGDASITYLTTDILYLDLSQLGVSFSSGAWGSNPARVYSGSSAVVASLTSISGNVATFSSALSFTYSQKIYNSGGVNINAYIYRSSDLISSATATIAMNLLEGSQIAVTFSNEILFGSLGVYYTGLPTVIKASFSTNAILQASTGTIMLSLADSTYGISATSGCLVFSSSSTNLILEPLKCQVSVSGTSDIISITSPTYNLASGSAINVYFALTNNQQISTGVLLDVYSSYSSSTSYSKISSIGTINSNTVASNTGSSALDRIFPYPLYVYQYMGASNAVSTNYVPLRIRFQLYSTGTMLPSNNAQIQIQASASAFYVASSMSIFCYFKAFINPTTKFKTQYTVYYPAASCTLNSPTMITVPVPSPSLNKDTIYELVITSKYSSNKAIYYSSNVGLKSFTSTITLSISFLESSAVSYYSVDRLWTFGGGNYNSNSKLDSFYITSQASSENSIIFLSFKQTTASFSNFPQSYFELEFKTSYNMFPNQILGSQSRGTDNLCYSSLTTIGTGYQTPRCIIADGSSTNSLPSVIRFENYKLITTSTEVSLSTEQIVIPSSTSPMVDLKLVLYKYSSPTTAPARYFLNIFDVFSIGSTTTISTPNANFATFTNFYWLTSVGVFGGPSNTANWFPGNSIGDKMLIIFPSSMATLVNFASMTISFTGGAAFSQLYINSRNYYILLRFTAVSASTSPIIQFSSISLPSIGTLSLSQIFSANVFKSFQTRTELTLTLPSGSITALSSTSGSVFPSTVSDAFVGNFYTQGTNWFSISLSNLAFGTGVNILKISSSSGTFLKCFLSGYFCHVSSGQLFIRNINPTTSFSSSSLAPYVIFKNTGVSSITLTAYYLVNGQVNNQVSASSATFLSSFQATGVPTTYQVNYQNALPWYFSTIEDLVITSATTVPLKIKLKFSNNLDAGDLVKITPPASPSNSFVTSTTLFCMIQVMSNNYQLGTPFYSDNCIYDASPLYTFAIPKAGSGTISSSNYHLITINTMVNAGVSIPTVNARYETLLTVEHPSGTTTQTDVVYIQPLPIPFTTLAVNHLSITTSQFNFIEVKLQLNAALISQWISTLSSPTQEMVLVFEFDNNYFSNSLGMTTSGSLQYKYSSAISSGDQCDHSMQTGSSPTTSFSSKSNFLKGDTTINPKIVIPIHDVFSSTATYWITIPMILNPTSANQPLNFKIWSLFYDVNQAYPIVLFYYSLRNIVFTVSSTVNAAVLSLSTSGIYIQQTSVSLGVTFTSPSSVTMTSTTTDRWAFRILNGYKSSSFASATSALTMIYFPITSFFLLRSTGSISSNTALSLNGLSLYDYVSSFTVEGFIFRSSYTYGSGTVTTSMSSNVLNSQSGTFSRIEGLTNYNSEGLYSATFTFTPLTIPNFGYIKITLPSVFSPITNLGLGDYCSVIAPTNEGANTDGTNNVIYCYQDSSNSYKIQGFGSQGTTVTITLNLYLMVVASSGSLTLSSFWIYGVLGNSASQIIEVTFTGSESASSTNYLASLTITDNFVQYVYANQWGPMEFNFMATTTGGLQYANSAQLVLILPTGFTLATGGNTQTTAQYGPSSGNSFVSSVPTVSSQQITIPIIEGFGIPANVDYTLIINTVLGATNNGIQASDPYLYTFILEWMDGSSLIEWGSYDYQVLPSPSSGSSSIVALNEGNSQATIMLISIIPDRNIANLNFEIQTDFFTNDGFNDVFLDDVGSGMTSTQKALEISCSEPLSINVIASSRISCVLWKGDATTSTPAILRIPISTAITSGTTVSYYIASLSNPSIGNYVSGVQVKVSQKCRADGLMCDYFNVFMTYTTTTTTAISYNYDILFNPSRSVSLSNTLIYKTGVTHSYSLKFTGTVAAGDYLIFIYPQYNLVLSDTCTSSYGSCMTFPICNWVFLTKTSGITASTTSTVSFVITNARYVDAVGQKIDVQAWSHTSKIPIDAQQYNHPGYSPFVSTVARPITLAITPTRTTPLNYWLKNFMNYATLTANGVWYNSEVTWFKLVASSGVYYFDTSSCNASLTLASPLRNDPYGARFLCKVVSSNVIQITLNPNYPFPAFTTNFETWQLSIDFWFWIDPSTTASSITFTVYGCAIATTNTYISKGTVTFNIDPYPQPIFSDLTFNTNSFYDRIGLPGGKVEFYMLLIPSTQPSDYVINKLVYTIPNDFGYPAVPSIDCIMEGAATYPVTSCVLQRIGGRTLVTLIPSVYNNEVKIVRLTYNAGNIGLFTVPLIGGNNYVLQVDMYSGNNQLVERGIANISQIYPGTLNIAGITIEPQLDALTFGLFKVTFQVGSSKVPAGYNLDTFPYFSNLVVGFQTTNGYDSTLGTNLANNSAVDCACGSGITVNYMGKLNCRLKIGTNSEDLPEIQIYDYDEIAASTTVTVYIANIKTLAANITAPISLAARLYYKVKYGIVYLYKPIDYLPTANTAFSGLSSVSGTASVSGTPMVLQLLSYTFTFTLSAGITSADYIVFQFPKNMFDQNADTYSGVSTDVIGQIYVFPVSNILYFQPTSILSSGSQTLKILNLIAPGYVFSSSFTVNGWSLVSQKVVDQFSFSVNLNIAACSIFTIFAQSANNYYSSQNNVTLTFTFMTGHNLPKTGSIRISLASNVSTIETIYGNLVNLGASCVLSGFDPSTICQITADSVWIYLQGVSINKAENYTVSIIGTNNPSIMDNSLMNTITTYFDSGSLIICKKSYPIPTIITTPINSCGMQIKLDYQTMGQYSNYYFSIGCNGVIRQNTELRLILPISFGTYLNGDFIDCSSDNNILTSNKCQVDLTTMPNFILIKAQANGLNTFSGLVLQLNNVLNPILPSPYFLNNIAAHFFSYSLLYGSTENIYSIAYAQELANQANSGEVFYNRLFSNTNEESTYFFSIIKSTVNTYPVNTISIQFPEIFFNGLGDSLVCGGYFTPSSPFTSTLNLIQYIPWRKFRANSSNFDILSCTVNEKTVIIQNAYNYAQNHTYFFNIFIENIINPSTSGSVQFSILYSYSTYLDWVYNLLVVINAGSLPQIIQITNISLTTNNVRSLATYSFTVGFTNGNFLTNYISPIFSLQLPNEYTQVLLSKPSFNCYNTLFLKKSVIPTCEIYGQEIIIEPYPLNTKNTNEFVITYDKLINPNMKTSCSNTNSLTSLFTSFTLKMIDISNNNILAKNVPALDVVNCIEFQQNAFVAYLQMNQNMLLGLSYQVNVILEAPVDGLNYQPSITGSDTTGIQLNANMLTFSGYNVTNMSFFISSELLTQSGAYVLHSKIYESTSINFYLPILDQIINFIPASKMSSYNDATLKKAIVSIGDISILNNLGNPIEISVYCSQNPADSLFFSIQYNTTVLKINPSTIEFNLNVNMASFTIQTLRSDTPYQIVNFSLSVNNPYITQNDIPFVLSETSRNFTISAPDNNYVLEIFGIKNNTINKNIAQFQVYTSKPCYVFYFLTYIGSPIPSQAQMLDNTLYPASKIVAAGSINSVAQYNTIMDYIAPINFTTLEGDSKFVLYALAQDSFSTTNITSLTFKTKMLSFSWSLKMNFLENVTFSTVQTALSLTLRLPVSRFVLLSNHQVNSQYNPNIMKPQPIIYEILIAPDPFNDEVKPRYYAQLMTTQTYIMKVKSILSQFNEIKGIIAYEYRLNPPKVLLGPQKLWAKYYETLISMSTVSRCKIYAIRILNSNPNLNNSVNTPLSKQISKGMNKTNDYLNKTPYYVFSGVTDQNGYIEILMQDLLDGNTYDIYITVGNNYPYEPTLLLADDEVQHIRITTPINNNVKGRNVDYKITYQSAQWSF